MKKLFIAMSILFFSQSAFSAFSCSALCTRYQVWNCGNLKGYRYFGNSDVTGFSTESMQAAFEDMRQRCRARTPSAYSVSLDAHLQWRKACGVNFLTKQSISATISNSCIGSN